MRTASTKDIAEALHVEPTTVQRYAREGRIPFDVTPGGHRRFDVAEVVEFLEAEQRPFVARRDFQPLAGGAEVVWSPTALVTLAGRTMRAEEDVTDAVATQPRESAVTHLFGRARRVFVATSR
jgi:excisionase family DNA binding protein